MRSEFFERIKSDGHYRTKSLLTFSFVFNIIYAVFLFIVSRIYFSKWFFVMAIYYGLLSLTRVFIFANINPKKEIRSKIKTMRACGFFLLLINLVVSTMMFILIYSVGYVKHHEITVIALATYTFTSLTVAIVSSVRQLKKNDYVHFSAKIISLVSASVSLVTLTNTMLVTFGEENLLLRSIILPLLCGAVAIFIVLCAILMLRKANSDLGILKNEKERK